MTFSLRTPSGDSLLVPDDVSIEVSVDEDGLMRLSTELYVNSVDIEADSVQSFAGRPSSGTTTGPSSPTELLLGRWRRAGCCDAVVR